jgi:hypothetical protein
LGKQVGFYAGPRDIEILTQELRGKGATVICERTNSFEPVIASHELPTINDHIRAWLVRREDLALIKWRQYPQLGYRVLNQEESPAVQFNGPVMNGHTMSAGRLWFSTETAAGKSEDYLRWADSLLRVPRRLFTKLPRPEGYAYAQHLGPHAAELLKARQIVLDDPLFVPR